MMGKALMNKFIQAIFEWFKASKFIHKKSNALEERCFLKIRAKIRNYLADFVLYLSPSKGVGSKGTGTG